MTPNQTVNDTDHIPLHQNLTLYDDLLGVPPPLTCLFLIADQCPCITLCTETEEWVDCCPCEPCCVCGM